MISIEDIGVIPSEKIDSCAKTGFSVMATFATEM